MSEIAYKYIGDGAFVVDLPARDILVNETEFHVGCEANSQSSLPCYKKVKSTKPTEEVEVIEKVEAAKPAKVGKAAKDTSEGDKP